MGLFCPRSGPFREFVRLCVPYSARAITRFCRLIIPKRWINNFYEMFLFIQEIQNHTSQQGQVQ